MAPLSRVFNSVFFLVFCLCVWSCQSQTKIVNNINSREANEIVVLLNSRGIMAQKTPAVTSTVGGATSTEQMWDISVPSNQITESLAILNQAGLPRVKGTTLLNLFGSQGLVPSDMQDRIRYQEGLSEQIASTIRKMDGIIDADVQISFPRDEEENRPLTASVYIKHQGVLDNPNSLLVIKIKRLVASAVPGLTIDNVSVVSDRATYADLSLPSSTENLSEGREYVSIWSVIIAKESAGRFRAIFYTFILLLFIAICSIIWMVWKFYPIIISRGGMKLFLSPEQISVETPPVEEKSEEEEL